MKPMDIFFLVAILFFAACTVIPSIKKQHLFFLTGVLLALVTIAAPLTSSWLYSVGPSWLKTGDGLGLVFTTIMAMIFSAGLSFASFCEFADTK